MTESGHELRDNNEKIVRLMAMLKKQRDEMTYLIVKQEEEKFKIQTEIERLSFKLTLLVKSLGQRVHARDNYERTIKEIEERYQGLVVESGRLLNNLNKEVQVLENIMDKKTGTSVDTTFLLVKEVPANPSVITEVTVNEKMVSVTKLEDVASVISVEEVASTKSVEKKKSQKSLEEKHYPKFQEDIKSDKSLEEMRKPSRSGEEVRSLQSSKTKESSSSSKSAGLESKGSSAGRVQGKSISDTEKMSTSTTSSNGEEEVVQLRQEEAKKCESLDSKCSTNCPAYPKEETHANSVNKVVDDEVQSFREAYGKQHSEQHPYRRSNKH